MKDLWEEISIEGFDYADFRNGEQTIIKPRLEELGYSNIFFQNGEADSFGPLSRVVLATDGDDNSVAFIYG